MRSRMVRRNRRNARANSLDGPVLLYHEMTFLIKGSQCFNRIGRKTKESKIRDKGNNGYTPITAEQKS